MENIKYDTLLLPQDDLKARLKVLNKERNRVKSIITEKDVQELFKRVQEDWKEELGEIEFGSASFEFYNEYNDEGGTFLTFDYIGVRDKNGDSISLEDFKREKSYTNYKDEEVRYEEDLYGYLRDVIHELDADDIYEYIGDEVVFD